MLKYKRLWELVIFKCSLNIHYYVHSILDYSLVITGTDLLTFEENVVMPFP